MKVPEFEVNKEVVMPIRIFNVKDSMACNYAKRDLMMKVCDFNAYVDTDIEGASDCDDPEELKEFVKAEVKRLNLITAYVILPYGQHILVVLYWNDGEGNWKVYGAPTYAGVIRNNISVDSKAQDCIANQFMVTHMPYFG